MFSFSCVLNVCLIINNQKCTLQMENLKHFMSLTRQPGQLGFLEYTPAVVPSSSAAHSKHDRVSPDTVCYYGSDNTDSETTLQMRYAKLEVGQNKTWSKLVTKVGSIWVDLMHFLFKFFNLPTITKISFDSFDQFTHFFG
ncbi:hypothetical protein Hanom_Chr02g00168291 [Helianthus anomalus]